MDIFTIIGCLAVFIWTIYAEVKADKKQEEMYFNVRKQHEAEAMAKKEKAETNCNNIHSSDSNQATR